MLPRKKKSPDSEVAGGGELLPLRSVGLVVLCCFGHLAVKCESACSQELELKTNKQTKNNAVEWL